MLVQMYATICDEVIRRMKYEMVKACLYFVSMRK